MSGRTTRRRVLRVTLPSGDAPGTPAGDGAARAATLTAAREVTAATRADFLATEEPLGIRVDGTALTMTMRTPGDDLELAAGFLVSEAVIATRSDIADIRLCDGSSCRHGAHDDHGMGNVADVRLAPGVTVTSGARRSFMTTSACGVCGKTSIEDISAAPRAALSADETPFSPAVLASLPDRLRDEIGRAHV